MKKLASSQTKDDIDVLSSIILELAEVDDVWRLFLFQRFPVRVKV